VRVVAAAAALPLQDGWKPRRIEALTGIRFVAAMLVLVFHYGASYVNSAGAPWFVVNFLRHGYLGVSLFFILSGFILTYTYQGRVCDKWRGAYFFARFARIYPVYLLALLIAFPVTKQSIEPSDAIRVLTLVQSWAPGSSEQGYAWIMQAWTLSVEFFFYLIFPFLLPLVLTLRLAPTLALAGLCCMAMILFGIPTLAPGSTVAPTWGAMVELPLPVLRAVEFMLGMLTCRVITLHQVAATPLIGNIATSAVGFAIVSILCLAADPRILGFAMALSSVLLAMLATMDSLIASFLSTRALVVLGAASYAMYIVQQPVRNWMYYISDDMAGRLASPVVTIVVSLAMYFLWERPARTWLLAACARLGRSRSERGQPDRGLVPVAATDSFEVRKTKALRSTTSLDAEGNR